MSQALVMYLLSLMLRSIGVALIAAICTYRMQNVALRHAVWVAVLGVMMLMPVADTVLPILHPPSSFIISTESAPPMSSSYSDGIESAVGLTDLALAAAVNPTSSFSWNWWQVVGTICVLVSLLLTLQIGLAHRQLRRIRSDSRKISNTPFNLPAVDLRESESIRVPITIGFLRPSVICPADWHTWGEWKLRAVLAHELAHIRRADSLITMLAALNTAFFWYNPLSWWLERRLAVLCEEASDEAAVSLLGDPARYSEVLLQFATAHVGNRLRAGGVAMVRRNIATRIDRILRVHCPECGVLTRVSAVIVLALAFPVLYAASAIHMMPEAVTTVALRVPGQLISAERPPAVSKPLPTPVALRPAQTQSIAGTLSGTILGPGGSVAPGTKITISDGAHKEVGSAVTDRFNEFEITGVPVGIYWLQATGDYNSASGPFTAVVRLDLRQAGSLKFTSDKGPFIDITYVTQVKGAGEAQSRSLAFVPPSFEVASIKPAAPLHPTPLSGPVFRGGLCHAVDGIGEAITLPLVTGVGASFAPALGRCHFASVTLKMLVQEAFDVGRGQTRTKLEQLIVGGPDWTDRELFDIEAKADDPSTTTVAQLWEMVQTLVRERFQLQFHLETREVPGLALHVTKDGPKFKEHTGDDPSSYASNHPTPTDNERKSFNQPIGDLAGILAMQLDRPVLDQTGLNGKYDYSLKWARDGSDRSVNPALPTALQEQLGLRLDAQNVSVIVLVIDRAEKPSQDR